MVFAFRKWFVWNVVVQCVDICENQMEYHLNVSNQYILLISCEQSIGTIQLCKCCWLIVTIETMLSSSSTLDRVTSLQIESHHFMKCKLDGSKKRPHKQDDSTLMWLAATTTKSHCISSCA